jgi:hypothetical protein
VSLSSATGAVMKKLVLVILLLSAFSFAANKPSDYNIDVHVSASNIQIGTNGYYSQFLNVLIDGRKYELEADLLGPVGYSVLALGDYKAKLVKDEHKTTYQSIQIYEFLFADGKTMKFDVVGTSE